MHQIRLSDADRKRFGCEEWLDFDVRDISIGDLDELAERFDFDPDDWPRPLFGELTLEQAGDPDAKPKPPRWQFRAAVWMALRQAEVDVSWEDTARVRHMKAVVRQVGDLGKDDPVTEPSTTRPSDTSSD